MKFINYHGLKNYTLVARYENLDMADPHRYK